MAQHTIDPAAVAAYQFGGQDIPWLIDHWAEHRGEHPFLIWEPKDGSGRTWTYAEFAEATKRVAAGLAARGVSASATWCSSTPRTAPRPSSPGTRAPGSAPSR